MTTPWSDDIENLLESIRQNCIHLTRHHKTRYFYYKQVGTWFRIPTVIISSIASVSSVGLTAYLSQANISGVVCLMTLSVSILNSIELYMKINETTELELETSKKYYQLSIDVHKVLQLNRINRKISGADALEKFYRDYTELYEASALVSNSYTDKLALIPKKALLFKQSPTASSSSSSSISSIGSNPMDPEIGNQIAEL